MPRGAEIRMFLADYINELNRGEKTEPIDGIVILDDDYTVGDQNYLKRFWIKTYWDDTTTKEGTPCGLQPEHVAEAIRKIELPFKMKLQPHEVEEVSPEND